MLHPWIPIDKLDASALAANPYHNHNNHKVSKQPDDETKKRKRIWNHRLAQWVPIHHLHDKDNDTDKDKASDKDKEPKMVSKRSNKWKRLQCRYPHWFDDSGTGSIHWSIVSAETDDDAFVVLANHPHRVDWKIMCQNASVRAIDLLRNHMTNIRWDYLALNPHDNAIQFMSENPSKVDWFNLCSNTNPKAMQLICQHIQYTIDHHIQYDVDDGVGYGSDYRRYFNRRLNWSAISANPCDEVITLLTQYPHCIQDDHLAANPHPMAIDIMGKRLPNVMQQFQHRIEDYLNQLCSNRNPLVLPLIQDHMHQLTPKCWVTLSNNPIIYQDYGYDLHLFQIVGVSDYRTYCKERMKTTGLAQELMANRFHPQHMDKWVSWGHEEEQDFV